MEDFPSIKEAKAAFGESLKINSVSLDDSNVTSSRIQKVVKKHGLSWDVAFSGDGFSDEMANKFYLRGPEFQHFSFSTPEEKWSHQATSCVEVNWREP